MTTWMDVLSRCLQLILMATLPVLAGILAAYVKVWLKQRQAEIEGQLNEQQLFLIHEAVRLAVTAAKQSGTWDKTLETGLAKKQYALAWAEHYLAQFNVVLDLETLSGLVEAAVWTELHPWKVTGSVEKA